MRYTALLALALIGGALPALAQDRTPPAGSLRALEAPIDWTVNQNRYAAPFEGRSVFRGAAPVDGNAGVTDGR